MRRHFPLLLFCTALAACAAVPPAPDDPLTGRIFETRSGRELDRQALVDRLADADVVYVGETHDNPRHHAIQLELLQALLGRGRRPAVALEMADTSQTGFLMHYAGGGGDDAAADATAEWRVRRQLQWQDDDNPHWERYGPLARLARAEGLVLFGLDLVPALRLRLQRVGRDGLDEVEKGQLPATAPREPAYVALMDERFKGAHCGFGSATGRTRLFDTWVARNDAMAAAVAAAAGSPANRPVLVVVGAGHLQYGRGVVGRVAQLLPGVRQVNLGLREVAPTAEPLAGYLDATRFDGVDFGPAHQLLWLTPRHDREDPCLKYRELLKSRHEAAPSAPAGGGP